MAVAATAVFAALAIALVVAIALRDRGAKQPQVARGPLRPTPRAESRARPGTAVQLQAVGAAAVGMGIVTASKYRNVPVDDKIGLGLLILIPSALGLLLLLVGWRLQARSRRR